MSKGYVSKKLVVKADLSTSSARLTIYGATFFVVNLSKKMFQSNTVSLTALVCN